MTRPVVVILEERFFTVTVAFCVPAGRVVGETSKPADADSAMSPVRFSALTVNVCVAPVPLMVSSSADVSRDANKGA